jgi:hypothetical protein
VHFKKIEKVGRDYGRRVEIPHGLDDNDLVIANPGERLKEGGIVQLPRAPAVTVQSTAPAACAASATAPPPAPTGKERG